MAGFEPTNAGVKDPCLTTWLHPSDQMPHIKKKVGWDLGFEPRISGATNQRSRPTELIPPYKKGHMSTEVAKIFYLLEHNKSIVSNIYPYYTYLNYDRCWNIIIF